MTRDGFEAEDADTDEPTGSSLNLRARSSCDDGPTAPAPQPMMHADTGSDEGHLLDYLRVLHKRRWTAGTAFLIVLASVTVYTFTATPLFEARTRLLIEAESPNVINFKEVIDEQGTRADYYQTQYSILQSRSSRARRSTACSSGTSRIWVASGTVSVSSRRSSARLPAAPTGSARVRGRDVGQSRAIDLSGQV